MLIAAARANGAITLKSIAEKVGELLELPTRSITSEEAASYFPSPFHGVVFATDAPASATLTREWLGWEPTHPTLLEDVEFGDYISAPATRSAGTLPGGAG